MIYTYHYDSLLGGLTLASDGEALTGLFFEDHELFDEMIPEGSVSVAVLPEEGAQEGIEKSTKEGAREDVEEGTHEGAEKGAREGAVEVLRQAARWLDTYFDGKDPGFTPPIRLGESSFRNRVCEIMLDIPFGGFMTYGQIAEMVAEEKGVSHMSAQAVGGAVGGNPIPIIIPCHRVIGSDGSLTGYGEGLDKKLALLLIEDSEALDLVDPESRQIEFPGTIDHINSRLYHSEKCDKILWHVGRTVFMQEALKEAKKAFYENEVPVGAVVVKDGLIIGRGRNGTETAHDPTAHAEIRAIRQAAERLGSWRLTGCDLYVTVEPCSMCAGAIVWSRIRSVYFATPDPKAGACGSLYNIPQDERLNHQTQIFAGLMQKESEKLMKDFFKKLRQKNPEE